MNQSAAVARPVANKTEYFDVLVVGAGISGVGGAYHLTHQCSGTSFVVLEAQESFGGTWITHRYPGIRSDSDFVCRLHKHMNARHATVVTPVLRAQDLSMPLLPWIAPENFNPGYVTRGPHLLPKQGQSRPWRHTQDYWTERDELPAADLDDGTLVFE